MNSISQYPIPDWAYDSLEKRKYVLNQFIKPNAKGAELGVFRGLFSEFILITVNPKLFYMVDGWELLFGEKFSWGGDYTCNGTLPTAVAKSEAIERTSFHNNRHVITSTTEDFLLNLTEKMDFFYFYATHQYESVLNELNLIHNLDLLADDGVIIGDDWIIDPKHQHHGICRAVNDFVREQPYQLIHAHQPTRQFVLRKTPQY